MKMIRFDKQIKQKCKSRKIPKDFNKIPGSKILGNPVPKNPGIEILDPARAWSGYTHSHQVERRRPWLMEQCGYKTNEALRWKVDGTLLEFLLQAWPTKKQLRPLWDWRILSKAGDRLISDFQKKRSDRIWLMIHQRKGIQCEMKYYPGNSL